ncbi:MAG TPA: HEAT repeat domain-containing protein, partial [Planctomycetota bacterium]|nr:HEAT repeat domain-containing protein [Planctomycetota bacterium]
DRLVRVSVGAAAVAAVVLLALAARDARRESRDAAAEAGRAAAAAQAAAAGVASAGERLSRLEAEAVALAELIRRERAALEEVRREGAAGRDALDDRLEGVERSLGTVLEAAESLRRDLAEVRGTAGLTEAEERSLLERMADANAGARFEALWRLQRGSGPAARAAAVKGLSDPEDGVRWQAAVLARVLKVREAAPALVECLSSSGPAVRAAALDALRELEGTDLGYDPLEPAEERRAAALARWKERVAGR